MLYLWLMKMQVRRPPRTTAPRTNHGSVPGQNPPRHTSPNREHVDHKLMATVELQYVEDD